MLAITMLKRSVLYKHFQSDDVITFLKELFTVFIVSEYNHLFTWSQDVVLKIVQCIVQSFLLFVVYRELYYVASNKSAWAYVLFLSLSDLIT